MITYQIVITEPAENDLQFIINYISKELQNPFAAKNLLDKVVENINHLKILPGRFSLVNDIILANRGIRKLTVDNYIIFFIVSETNRYVTIIRILYGKRHWQHLL